MQEIAEFRVDEKFASKLFAGNEGKKLGDSIRKIELATDDSRFNRIGELQKNIMTTTDLAFFYCWDVRRHYTKDEITAAECFQLSVPAVFEPAGEECGTKYDESTACPKCGAGAAQVSDLYLDMRKIHKNKHITCTIAEEVIVSQFLAERMTDANLTGFELRPVRHKAFYDDDPIDLYQLQTGREILRKAKAAGAPHPTTKFYVWLNRAENNELWQQAQAEYAALKGEEERRNRKPMPVWYQLVISSSEAEIVPPTKAGITPFDEDKKGECRCPSGDLIGLNLLSEVSIKAASRGDADIVCSRQFVGARRGLLRPRRVMLISPKFWRLLDSEKIKGFKIEIAHIV